MITRKKYGNSDGFAMIAVLLALLILVGLSALIFVMTTRDIRVSMRTVGEKKAFSGAQTSISQALQNFSPGTTSGGNVNDPTTWPQVPGDPDPNTRYYYSIGSASTGCSLPPPGFDIEKWSQSTYDADIRGANTAYVSQVTLSVGLGVFKSGTCSKTTE